LYRSVIINLWQEKKTWALLLEDCMHRSCLDAICENIQYRISESMCSSGFWHYVAWKRVNTFLKEHTVWNLLPYDGGRSLWTLVPLYQNTRCHNSLDTAWTITALQTSSLV
jgi:hypothetical protein